MNFYDSFKNAVHGVVRETTQKLVPPPKQPQFEEHGMLTPQQFIIAGQNLVKSCPSWQWKKALDPKHSTEYLPADKQYLIMQKAKCMNRIKDIMQKTDERVEKSQTANEQVIVILSTQGKQNKQKQKQSDITNFQLEQNKQIRFYNLYITYDLYYFTPRIWFNGFNINGQNFVTSVPLKTQEIFQDVMEQYKNKTLTIQKFPFIYGLSLPSVHPCKHANVLKTMSAAMQQGGNKKVGAHSAMFIFLKFIASVIPSVEYDLVGELYF